MSTCGIWVGTGLVMLQFSTWVEKRKPALLNNQYHLIIELSIIPAPLELGPGLARAL